jgi:hypothetical protein
MKKMKINPQIIKVLKENNINREEGLDILYLIYFDRYNSPLISSIWKEELLKTNIFITTKTGRKWNIPLFIDENVDTSWVEPEYCTLFTELGKLPFVPECTKKMSAFLKLHTDITKEEIIEATKYYIRNTTTKYIRESHYFISKGVGSQQISDLYTYVGIIRNQNRPRNNTDITQNLQ